jgi:hypothetical protein
MASSLAILELNEAVGAYIAEKENMSSRKTHP